MPRPAAALLIIIITIALPAWSGDAPLTRSHPGHVGPPPSLPWLPPPPADAQITVPEKTITWVHRDTPYWDQGRLDPVLSNACALGRFLPTESIFKVSFRGKEGRGKEGRGKEGGGVMTAVPSHRHDLLIDPAKLARRGEVYYFRNEGWPDCEVRYDGNQPPRQLNEAGTSLPRIDWEQRKAKALDRLEQWRARRE